MGLRYREAPKFALWNALASSRPCNPEIKQAYGVEASVSGRGPLDNLGEANFTALSLSKGETDFVRSFYGVRSR
jgi:hypothetical protein